MQDQQPSAPKELPNAPGVKIIRAGEESVWRDGYRFLAEAKDIYAAERDRGYAEGMLAAKSDAAKLVAETSGKVDRYLASLEGEVARLAFDIVRRVLSEFDNAELVAKAARNALADFREAKSVRIRVHPSAESHVRAAIETYAGENGHGAPSVVIEADEEIGETACVLSTEFAVVDATIEAQLTAMAAAMGLGKAKPAE